MNLPERMEYPPLSSRFARRPRAKARKLALESLEERCLLASNGLIVYGSFDAPSGPGASQIFTADPAAGPASADCIRVGGVCDPQGGSDPAWSADGSKLLFTRSGDELWVMDAEGSNQLPVLDEFGSAVTGRTPTWYGDSDAVISFAGVVGSTYDILYGTLNYFADHATIGGIINLTNDPNNDFSPSWNFDGTELVFDTDRGNSGGGDIYLISNPFDASPVTTNLTADRPTCFDARPDWSPDGTEIVFTSSCGSSDIWTMDSDGGNKLNLTNDAASDDAPAWSPDGTMIVFSSSRPVPGAPVQDSEPEIFVMNADGSGLTAVTSNTANTFDWTPDWQPVLVTDLDLDIRDVVDPIAVEDIAEYRVKVHNSGPLRATGIVVTTEPLPASVDFNSIINPPISDPNVTCSIGADRRVTCEFGDLDVGTSLTTSLKLRLNEVGTFTLTATATINETDDDLGSNTTSETTTVVPSSDVSVFLEAPDEVPEGADFNLTFPVPNAGPSGAEGVRVELQLDRRLEFRSAPPELTDGFQCTHVAGIVTCDRDFIGHLGIARPQIVVRPIRTGLARTFAVVSVSGSVDINDSNDTRTLETVVRPGHDDFADSDGISGLTGSVSASNLFATKESQIVGAAEPNHAGNAGGASVWYDWVAGRNGTAIFNTLGSDFDTLLTVYEIVGGNLRVVAGSVPGTLASNDDAPGVTTSAVSFDADDGGQYFIAVDGFDNSQGNLFLNWSQIPEVVPAPTPQHIHEIAPAVVLTGADTFVLTINGSGFSSGSQVRLDGDACRRPPGAPPSGENCIQTTFVNSTQLQAHVPASFLTNAASLNVTVERVDNVSESATFLVEDQIALPAGTDLRIGDVIVNADTIFETAGGARSARAVSEVYELSGDVNLNDFFAIEGSSIVLSIDRAANTAQIVIDTGSIRLTNIPVLGDVTLWSGDHYEFSFDGAGQLTELFQTFVVPPLRERGVDVTVSQARLLLGTEFDNGVPILGMELEGSLKFTSIAGLVNIPISFDKLSITNAGVGFSTEIGPLSFCLPCVPFAGGFLGSNMVGVQDVRLGFSLGATPFEDTFSGSGEVAIPGIAASATVEIKGGELNRIGGGIKLPALSTGIQLGPINISGGSLELGNLLDLRRLEVFVGVSDLTLLPGLAHIISLDDVGIRYFVPARLRGEADLELFGFDVANVSLDLDIPARTFSFGGSVELIPSLPIFEVEAGLTTGIRNDFLFIEGFAQGTVQIPDGNGGLYDFFKACRDVLGVRIGPCVEFPIELASVRVSYYDGLFSYSHDLPVIDRAVLAAGQVRGAFQATVDLFHNIPRVGTRLIAIGSHTAARSGNGVILGIVGAAGPRVVAEATVPAGAPHVIFDLSTATLAPRYTLIAPDGTRITPESARSNNAEFFQNTDTNDSFFVVTSPAAGTWSIEAEDDSQGPFEFEAWGINAAPEITNVQAIQTGPQVEITYSASDADDDAAVSLYYSRSAIDRNGVLIVQDLPESETGSFMWNTGDGSVPSGEYFIYALAADELNTPAIQFAPTKVTVIDPLAPAQPQGVSAVPGAENTVIVSWSPNNEADLGGYIVRFATDEGDGTVLTNEVFAGTDTSVELIGLASNTTYRVSVIAFDENEVPDPDNPGQTIIENRYSLPSAAVTAMTDDAMPPLVTITSPNGGEKIMNNQAIHITWDIEQGDDLFQQHLFVSSDGGASFDLLTQVDPAAREFTWHVPVSVRGEAFRFQIIASDESGNVGSDASDSNVAIRSAGVLQFSQPTYTVDESGGVATITVTRTDGGMGTVAVDFFTADDTTDDGEDYETRRATLTFLPGETSQTINIPILDDLTSEGDESVNLRLRNVRGGAMIGGQVAAVLSIRDDEPTGDTTGPTISDVQLIADTKGIQRVLLTANEPLLPTSANNATGYTLKLVSRNKKTGATTFVTIPIRTASVDATGQIVTLTPASAIRLNQFIQIAALGATGPTDPAGNHVDGNGDGTAGDDYATVVGLGTSLAYTDRNSDAVSLKLSKGGIMQLTRAADGEGQQLSLLNTAPGRSTLSGTVKKPKRGGGDNRTNLTSITGITGVRNSLPINPPSPATGRFVVGSIAAIVDSLLESGDI